MLRSFSAQGGCVHGRDGLVRAGGWTRWIWALPALFLWCLGSALETGSMRVLFWRLPEHRQVLPVSALWDQGASVRIRGLWTMLWGF